jgi:hypothetical protein
MTKLRMAFGMAMRGRPVAFRLSMREIAAEETARPGVQQGSDRSRFSAHGIVINPFLVLLYSRE